MPVTVTHTLYRFEELSARAKENARDWWRELEQMDDLEPDYDDFEAIANILGIKFDAKPIKLMSGGTRYQPTIYWSGFYSQGAGACFEGRYSYAKGASKAIRDYAPKDERLHAIADNLQDIQRKAFYRLEARCQHRGHYYHSGCMQVDVEHSEDSYRALPEGADATVTESLRDFADWIYRQLETAYEWRMADEQVDGAITANEYTFDEYGRRAD
jgi:hypothetical protein